MSLRADRARRVRRLQTSRQRGYAIYALPEPLVEAGAVAGAAGAEAVLELTLAALSEDALAVEAASPLAGAAAPLPFAFAAGAALALLPPRKSVTYQPEPFNWNPAAVTCLRKVSFPHSGQFVRGASLIF
jgi:hypothetical protein